MTRAVAECEHEWDDTRPMRSDSPLGPLPDSDIVPCKKCGAPLQLARRLGLWKGTPAYSDSGVYIGDGPPFFYMGNS